MQKWIQGEVPGPFLVAIIKALAYVINGNAAMASDSTRMQA